MKFAQQKFFKSILRRSSIFLVFTLSLMVLIGVVRAAPIIVALKTDVLMVDNDGDNVADPGDTLRYSVQVQNTGTTNATNVVFDDTIDANTTLVAGSLRTTPIARNDQYSSTGNVGISVPAGSGVLINDNDPDGTTPVLTIASFDASSANGGNVSVAGDGSFTYNPPPGFEGADQFDYTVQDSDGNLDPATVFITVSDVIWFVNNSALVQGDGRLNSPFNSLDGVNGYNATANDDPGDTIFIYSGSGAYTGGIALQNGQLLIGQGASQSIATIAGISLPPFSNALPVTGGSKPTITNSAGDGISLAANNLVRGLTAGNASGSSIAGSSPASTTNILETIINNSTGGGIEVVNGTLAVSLESLTTTSSGDEGIDLTNVAGSFSVSAGSISNTGSRAVNIDGNPSLALTVSLTSISSSSTANGILVRDTTGSFTVTGSGTTDGSGGTISNITTRGASFINTTNISLSNMTFSNASTTGVNTTTCDGLVNSGCNAAIHIESSSNIDLTNVDISNTAQQGINGLNVTDFDLVNSTITACGDEVNEGCLRMRNLGGTALISNSNLSFPAERVAQIENTSKTLNLTVSNSTFRDTQSSGLGADGLEITHNGASNATIDITNSSFLRNRTNGLQVFSEGNSFVSLDVTGSTFDRGTGIGIGMDLAANNSATLHFNVIGNPLINSRGSNAVNIFSDGSSIVQGRVNNNNIQAGGPTSSGFGIAAQANTNSTMKLEIDGNIISNIGFDAGIRVLSRLGGTGRLDAKINNNNVTVDATNSLYDIWVQAQDSNTTCANVTNNATSGATSAAFRVRTVDAASTVILQGAGATAAAVWSGNGNTPAAGPVSSSHNGTLTLGGTCNTVSHPTASLAQPQIVEKQPASLAAAPVINGYLAKFQESIAAIDLAAFRSRTNELASQLADQFVSAVTVRSARASGENVNQALGDLNPGQVVVISFDVTVDLTIPANVTQVCNQGQVTGNFTSVLTDDPDVGGASDPTCTNVPQADLEIDKSDSADPVTPGASYSYTVTVLNNGPSAAQSVIVADTLPAGVTFVSTSGCSNDPNGVPNCQLGSIASGGSKSFTINVTAPGSAGTITNNASVSSTTHDPVSGNNSTSEDTVVLTPVDLAISKDDGQTTAVPGEGITYTIVVSNNGPNDVSGATVSDTFPAALTGVTWTCSASSGSSCTAAGAGDINDSVSILNGGSLTYTVNATIDPSATGTLSNTAAVAPPAGFGDTNTANNTSTDTDTLTPEADLSVTKSDNADPVITGDNIVYTITVNNAGPSDAQNVVATDTLPVGVTFIATSGCAEDPNGVPTCSLGTIPAGGSAQYTIEVTTTSDGLITNNVSVNSDATDPDGGNNSASEDTTVLAPGTILVQKAVSQGDPGNPDQTFTLDIRLGNVILGGLSTIEAGDPPVGLGGLMPGTTYTVNEINLAQGWTLDDITCVNNLGSSTFGTFTPGDHSLEVTLAPGSVVLCTFTNVFNQAPVANDDSYSTDEDTTLSISAPGVLDNDTDADNDSLSAVFVTDASHGSLTLNSDGSFSYSPDLNYCGPDSFTYKANDGQVDSNVATVDITVNCVDDPPSVSVDVATQNVQYSDFISKVTISASDVDSASLSLTHDAFSDLSVSSGSCTPSGDGVSCTWEMTGKVRVAASTRTVTFKVSDATSEVSKSTQVVVKEENAKVTFDGSNPVAVPVSSPGGTSQPFTLKVHVQEASESGANTAPGDINLAQVTLTLQPVGPGSTPSPVTCSPVSPVTAFDYSAVLTVTCNFSGVPVNAYTAVASVTGGYYIGSSEDALVVYDPSLGFTTGGGWFYWPGSNDRTTFGFTMKYNKKGTNVQGNLVLIRHLPDGTSYRLKSNAVDGLALKDEGTFGWASFTGKATFKEPTWLEPEGNYSFTVYVEDRGEPGAGADRFWIEVRDKNGNIILALSISPDAPTNAVTIQGGNIVVPHGAGGRGKNR